MKKILRYMNKDFTQDKLLSFESHKQLRILYDLAKYIEVNQFTIESNHFEKLTKYHQFLSESKDDLIQKINKEFHKIKSLDYQFQIYLMLLERFLGQSSKEYEFLVNTKDSQKVFQTNKIICILDSIRSAHNVGAMIRNSECFKIKKLYLTGLTPKQDHPQVIKTAMNTQNLVETEYFKSALELIQNYKEKNYKIIGIETSKDAILLQDFKYQNEEVLLIFGHEQFGLSLEVLNLCDLVLKINLIGAKNSLNVSISQGIVLNHFVNS